MTGVRDYETGELKRNVVALATAAKVLGVPTIVTTTARDSMWGPTFPELVEVIGRERIIDRMSVNAWDDPKVAAAIEAKMECRLCAALVGKLKKKEIQTAAICSTPPMLVRVS